MPFHMSSYFKSYPFIVAAYAYIAKNHNLTPHATPEYDTIVCVPLYIYVAS